MNDPGHWHCLAMSVVHPSMPSSLRLTRNSLKSGAASIKSLSSCSMSIVGALVGWMSSGALLGRGRPQGAADWLESHLGSMLAMMERKGY